MMDHLSAVFGEKYTHLIKRWTVTTVTYEGGKNINTKKLLQRNQQFSNFIIFANYEPFLH